MSKFLSRKFVLTVGFAAIVVGNFWFVAKEPIAWEALLALAGVFGIYQGSNAYQAAQVSEKVMTSRYVPYESTVAGSTVEASDEGE